MKRLFLFFLLAILASGNMARGEPTDEDAAAAVEQAKPPADAPAAPAEVPPADAPPVDAPAASEEPLPAKTPVAVPPAPLPPDTTGETDSLAEPTVLPKGERPVASRRFWADGGALLWWVKGDHLPPLITASPAGTSQASAGVLGAPGTSVLFGGSNVNNDLRLGGQGTLGYWFRNCPRLGVEVNFFMLEGQSQGFADAANSTSGGILARPFTNALTGQPASELIAFPGVLSGSTQTFASSSPLLGAGTMLNTVLCCGSGCCTSWRLDGLAGYRYLRFNDSVGIQENLTSTAVASPIPPGTNLVIGDRFNAGNEFNGANLGFRGQYWRKRLYIGGQATLGLGCTTETVGINGITTVTVPGAAPVTSPGGLLALGSNIGNYRSNQFAFVPQVGLNLGYRVSQNTWAYVGYTMLYWSNVVMAGNQIDPTVNPNQLPPALQPLTGPLRPAPEFQHTNFWAQGITLGLQFRF